MPKKEINYQNTIIYKIVCKDLDIKEIYVGHTTNFTKRKTTHKYDSNSNTYNTKIYDIIQKNGGWENWDMIEIEKFPCNDRNEALARERFYYDTLRPIMNTYRPVITEAENKKYFETENGKAVKQRYYQKNKEKYIERVQKQREDKKTTQNNSPIQNNTSLIQNTMNVVDFIKWNKYMTYICVDIRDL